MSIYSEVISGEKTSQTEKLFGSKQVQNNAGGYSFEVSPLDAFRRFLILGSEGGTYYVDERIHTQQNFERVIAFIKENGRTAVDEIVEISTKARAPKNLPAIIALALCCKEGDEITRKLAADAIPQVCRIGTHLFEFLEFANKYKKKWNPTLCRGISSFYSQKTPDQIATQLLKYRNRSGYTHRDALRLSHAKPKDAITNSLFKWAVGKSEECEHPLVDAFLKAQKAKTDKEIIPLIVENKFSWEMIPTEFHKSVAVWEALLPNMGMTALIRNLGRLTSVGLLKEMGSQIPKIAERLTNREELKRAKVHPYQMLLASSAYQKGKSKGDLTWNPVQKLCAALEMGFEMAFDVVEPTGKRIMLALDVSGSMGYSAIANSEITARVGSAAMALVTYRKENAMMFAFADKFVPFDVAPNISLSSLVRKISGMPMMGTDCSLPMVYALKNKLEVDTFVIYTDNETYAGDIHPSVALQKYRKATGIPAKLIVVGMTSTGFTIADPRDRGMLDVVGFDASCPSLIQEFSKGE